MATQVQLRRGTAAENNAFTGAQGEVTVDTTNDTLRVHDGSQAGGYEIAKSDSQAHTNVDINSGTIDGTTIGGSTPAAGSFTTGQFDTSLNVDGTVTADGLTVAGNTTLIAATPQLFFDESDSTGQNLRMRLSSGDFDIDEVDDALAFSARRMHIDMNTGDIALGYEDTGTTPKLFWDASAESLGIGTTSPTFSRSGLGIRIDDSTAPIIRLDAGSTNVGEIFQSGAETIIDSRSPSGVIKFSVQDSETMRIDSSGNLLVGTTTNLNGSNFQVSAGSGASSTPYAAIFNTASSPTSSASTRLDLGFLSGSSNYVATNTTLGAINFMGQGNNGGYGGASIKAIVTSGGNTSRTNHSVDMVFSTMSSSSTGATEAMRIDSSGNLLVGTTDDTPSGNNDSSGIALRSLGQLNISRATFPCLDLNRKTNDGDIASFRRDGTTVLSIGTKTSTPYFVRSSGGGIALVADSLCPADSTGSPRDDFYSLGLSTNRFSDLYLAGGVYLGGTTSANYLDDYEEGTWDPVLGGSTSESGQSYTRQAGRYTKVGRLVTCTFNVILSTEGTISGNAALKGLPFTVSSTGPASGRANRGSVSISYFFSMALSSTFLGGFAEEGTTYATLTRQNTADANCEVPAGANLFTNTSEIIGSIIYYTDS